MRCAIRSQEVLLARPTMDLPTLSCREGASVPEAIAKYRDTSYPLSTLVSEIGRGAIALPEIQRPFVWSNTQVRNLFDSLYRGFPIGQIMWSRPEVGVTAPGRRLLAAG